MKTPLLALAAACAACATGVPELASRPARGGKAAGEGEVLVLRSADPVSVIPAGEQAAIPLAYYDKKFRAAAGSWVLVGPGGRAEIAFPDGTLLAASGSCALEIRDPGSPEGILFRAASAERLTVRLQGSGRAALPGGTVASGEGATFVLQALEGGLLRIEGRGSAPVRLRFEGEEVLLEPARYVDVPARARADGGGS